MDKEIIIDGVDVSECPNFKAGICSERLCELSVNEKCNYKQLKRLQHYQAEFEHELMNDYTYDGYISPNGFTPIDVIKHIKSELQRLEQENNSLQAQLNNITVQSNNAITALEQENERLKKLKFKSDGIELLQDANLNLHNANVEYRQALQEIRDITKEHIVCDDCNFDGTDKCDARMCTHFYLNDFSEEICDKINSVIGAEE